MPSGLPQDLRPPPSRALRAPGRPRSSIPPERCSPCGQQGAPGTAPSTASPPDPAPAAPSAPAAMLVQPSQQHRKQREAGTRQALWRRPPTEVAIDSDAPPLNTRCRPLPGAPAPRELQFLLTLTKVPRVARTACPAFSATMIRFVAFCYKLGIGRDGCEE